MKSRSSFQVFQPQSLSFRFLSFIYTFIYEMTLWLQMKIINREAEVRRNYREFVF